MTDSDENKRTFTILGRDVSKIPCFRNTYLYSISGGIGVGLVTFLFTSRSRLSLNVGLSSVVVICFSYWIPCRYKHAKKKFESAKLNAGLQKYITYEGTELEKKVLDNQIKDV